MDGGGGVILGMMHDHMLLPCDARPFLHYAACMCDPYYSRTVPHHFLLIPLKMTTIVI
eukprot:m.110340 g.110340  ORF g.110340 m.110340 type:complete len:58 (+) comp10711_c1_seq4:257-430(+)